MYRNAFLTLELKAEKIIENANDKKVAVSGSKENLPSFFFQIAFVESFDGE